VSSVSNRFTMAADLTAKLLERLDLPSDPTEAGKAVAAAFNEILTGIPDIWERAPKYVQPVKSDS
jgi:hypothetical protein